MSRQRLLAAFDRGREAVAVALVGQVALELRDEQTAVREDQHAERACGLDEARCGDRLAGRGRVTEPVATCSAGIRARVGLLLHLFVEDVLARLLGGLVLLFQVRLAFGDLGRSAVAVQLGLPLVRGDQLREHPGQRVDLMTPQLRA